MNLFLTAKQPFVFPCFALAFALAVLLSVTALRADIPDWADGTQWASGDSAATPVRIELRDSFGGRLVRGIETLGTPDGGAMVTWDTTASADGWVNKTATGGSGEQTVALAVLNAAAVALEEGRLTQNVTWGAERLHLLRNNVVVPNGVTLTIAGGTTVKFTEDTCIVVEDGGKLVVNDSAGNDVWFAQAEDDSIGGDTDMRNVALPSWATLAVRKFPSGTVTEHGYVALNGNGSVTLGTFGTISLNDAQGVEQSGRAFIPVTFTSTRTEPFSIEWVAEPGTATLGADYALASGTLEWTGSSQGTKYIEIPLVRDSEVEDAETFTVRITATRGINVARATASVTIVDTEADWQADWTETSSALVRVDTRESFGGRLVRGTETLGEPEGGAAVVWNTVESADGWHDRTSGGQTVALAVLNTASVSLEEGRLSTNTTWAADSIHLLRNHVVVPNGVTLTIEGGSIVKFTEDTQIVVEDGGKLIINDSAGNDVWLAQAEDDTIGGDTDMRNHSADWATVAVRKFPSGTVTEHGYVALNGNGTVTSDTFLAVSLNDAQVMEQSGKAFVPVTFSGTRNAPFSIDWVVEVGTATFGADYTQASGTLSWTGTSQGTKYIEIPLVSDSVFENPETFTVRVVASRGVNVAQPVATVTILDSVIELTPNEQWAGIVASAPTRVDTREGYGGRLVHGIETIGEPDGVGTTQWDTTALVDGWHTYSRGGETASMAVINSPHVSIEEGRLAANVTWTTETVHVVRNRVIVPSGVTLTIASGAVVKFTEDTGIIVEAGGVLNASGAIFTHIADDTVGGDTNADGNRSLPLSDQYTIEGAGQLLLADCDFRHRTVTLQQSGPLTSSQIWQGNCVYRVTGDIIIPNGITLTILEGAIIKFDAGKRITVNSGGALHVNGTLHNKVVLTSIKDDAHGGDTNKDGNASIPSMGDWKSLLISGSANFRHCQFLYGGNTNSGSWSGTESGVITYLSDSSGIIDCCQIFDGKFEGIISYANGLLVQNTTIAYCGRAINSLGGSASLVNCALYLFTDSLVALAHGGSLSLTNCAFSKVPGSFFYSNVVVKNCILWNPPGFGPQSESHAGQNGNRWADPLFRDPENGDFTLKIGSPCIDAGDGTVAPERDYFGQPRVDDNHVANTGTPDANGACPDIGIYEMTANAVSEVDLAINSIEAPQSANVGDAIKLYYTMTNVGSLSAKGTIRSDLVFISNYGSRVSANALSATLNLAPGESIRLEADVKVPALADGEWYPSVLVNSDRTISEGQNTANNFITATDAILITHPLSAAETNTVINPSSFKIFKFETTGSNRVILITAPEGLSIYASASGIPGAAQHDVKAVYCGNNTYALSVPPGAEKLYVTIENPTTVSKVVNIENTANTLRVFSSTLNKIPNIGQATFTLYGTGFSETTTIQLKSGDNVITPTSIKYISPTQLSVTMSPQYATAGNYQVIVSNITQSVTLSTTIQVTQVAIGPKLSARLTGIGSVRLNRENLAYIEYENIGDTDLPLPLFGVRGGRGISVRQVTNIGIWDSEILLIGIGQSHSAYLSPGEKHVIPFKYRVSIQNPGKVELLVIKEATDIGEGSFLSILGATKEDSEVLSNARDVFGNNYGSLIQSVRDYLEFHELYDEFAFDFRRVVRAMWMGKTEGFFNTISGKAMNSSMGIIPENDILLYREEEGNWNLFSQTTTDAVGGFHFCTLPDGKYKLHVQGRNFADSDVIYLTSGISVRNNISVTDGVGLSIRILNRENLKGGIIVRVSSASGEVFEKAAGENETLLTFDSLSEGEWFVSILHDGRQAGGQKTIDLIYENTVTEIALPKIKMLTGKIRNPAGIPLPDVKLRFLMGKEILEIRTDQNGDYNIEGFDGDQFVVFLEKDYYVQSRKTIALEEGSSTLPDCILETGCTVSGYVSTIGGNLNQDPLLFISQQNNILYSCATGSDNYYQITLPVGEYSCGTENMQASSTIQIAESVESLSQNIELVADVSPQNALAAGNPEKMPMFKRAVIDVYLALLEEEMIQFIGVFDLLGYKEAALHAAYFIEPLGPNPSSKIDFPDYRDQNNRVVMAAKASYGNVLQAAKKEIEIVAQQNGGPIGFEVYIKSPKVSFSDPAFHLAFGTMHGTYVESRLPWKEIQNTDEKIIYKVPTLSRIYDIYDFNPNSWNLHWGWEVLAGIVDGIQDRNFNLLEDYGWAKSFKTWIYVEDSIEVTIVKKKEDDGDETDIKIPNIPNSCDPNEMSGPGGVGEQQYVCREEWLYFKTFFENKSDAAAAAQEVYINNQLSEYLDWNSFEFQEIYFAGQIEVGLLGQKNGTIEVAQNGRAINVRVEAATNPVTGVVTWYMRCIDPTTADGWPLDPYDGFLKPNDATGCGEGYVAYRVRVKTDAPHNARIDSSAEIVFDTNPPITTDPAWFNTVYADPNLSAVPTITNQSDNTNVTFGDSATLSVSAVGYGTLSYQWSKDGVAIPDATGATLTFSNVQLEDAGVYSVTVSNAFNHTVSEPITVTVSKANATVTLGNLTHTYNGSSKAATATTDPAGLAVALTYDGETMQPVNAGAYAVVATVTDNRYQGSATGTLTISKAAQTITHDPITNQKVGSVVTLAAANSSGLLMTYVNKTPGVISLNGNRVTVIGVGKAIIEVKQAGNGNYGTGSYTIEFTTTSAPATVTLGNLTHTYNGKAKVATATTNPAGLSLTFTYDGAETSPINASSYAVVATVTDNRYHGSATGTLTIAKAAQTITHKSIGTQKVGSVVALAAVNSSGLPVTYINKTPGIISLDGNRATVIGAGKAIIEVKQAGNGNYTTGSGKIEFTTELVSLNITQQPQAATVKSGASMTFQVTATGQGALHYQWRKDGNPVIGAPDSATFTLNQAQVTNAGSYSVVVSDSYGQAITSKAAVLTVNYSPGFGGGTGGTDLPAQTTVIGNSVTLSVAVAGNPAPALQWQVSTDGGKTWTNIKGQTSSSLTLDGLKYADNGAQYRVRATNDGGKTYVYSTPTTLTGIPAVAPVIAWAVGGGSQTVLEGRMATLKINVTGGDGPFTYVWKRGSTVVKTTGGDDGKQFVTPALSLLDGMVEYSVTVTGAAGVNKSATLNARVTVGDPWEPHALSALTTKGVKLTPPKTFIVPKGTKLAKGTKAVYVWKDANGNVLLDAKGKPLSAKTYTTKANGEYTVELHYTPLAADKVTALPEVVMVHSFGKAKLFDPIKIAKVNGFVAEPLGIQVLDTKGKPAVNTVVEGERLRLTVKLESGTGPLKYVWYQNKTVVKTTGPTYALTDTFETSAIGAKPDAFSVVIETVERDAKGVKPLTTAKSKAIKPKVILTPKVSITTPASKLIAAVGKSVTIAAKATGTAKLNYEWRGPDGKVVVDAKGKAINKASLTLKPASKTDIVATGTYTVRVTNGAGENHAAIASAVVTGTGIVTVKARVSVSVPGESAVGKGDENGLSPTASTLDSRTTLYLVDAITGETSTLNLADDTLQNLHYETIGENAKLVTFTRTDNYLSEECVTLTLVFEGESFGEYGLIIDRVILDDSGDLMDETDVQTGAFEMEENR